MTELYMNDRQYYGFIHKQDMPLEQAVDATVAYVRGEMYRIVAKTLDIEDLDRLSEFYSKEKGFLKASFSPDENQENRFKIDEILED